MPCPRVFSVRFGGLAEAYRRVGYKPYRNLSWVARDQALVSMRREVTLRVIDTLRGLGASVQQDVRRQFMTINKHLTTGRSDWSVQSSRSSASASAARPRGVVSKTLRSGPPDSSADFAARISPSLRQFVERVVRPKGQAELLGHIATDFYLVHKKRAVGAAYMHILDHGVAILGTLLWTLARQALSTGGGIKMVSIDVVRGAGGTATAHTGGAGN